MLPIEEPLPAKGRRLTVLQVLPAMESGGVEKGTLEVARALVAQGHRSLVMSAGGQLVAPLQASGSEHLDWAIGEKRLRVLWLIPKLTRWLRENPVDILHVRSRLPAWIVHFALQRIPPAQRPHLITTIHGMYSVSRYSAIMTRAERVIAVSNTICNYAIQNYPQLDKTRLITIPLGIDPAQYPYGYQPDTSWLTTWKAQYPQLQSGLLLTLPGRLTRLKGHLDFLTLIRALRDQGCQVTGAIVGGVDPRRKGYAQSITTQIKQLQLEDIVVMTGLRSDMREIYAVSDLVLSLSSQPEAFGRTVIEALALGVPVAGYAHGGVGETLSYLYPAGAIKPCNVDDLIQRVHALLAHPVAVPQEQPWRIEDMLEQTLQLYQEVVK